MTPTLPSVAGGYFTIYMHQKQSMMEELHSAHRYSASSTVITKYQERSYFIKYLSACPMSQA